MVLQSMSLQLETAADDDGVRSYSGRTEFAAGVYTNIICQSDQIGAGEAFPAEHYRYRLS